jgi:signal transduction histidine kinase
MTTNPSLPNESQCHELLQGGLDLLDQGISVFDTELRLVAWNQTFLQLLEFPPAMAYVGAPFVSFIRYNAERGEYGPGDTETHVAERLASASHFAPHITERRRPNGKVILLRGEPLANKGFVTLYSDVTEQRYIENLSEYQNIQLDERVRRRTAQLENANANLRRANEEMLRMQAALAQAQKMEAIGQLTGGLAHDFNNLLTVIIGNLAALQDHRPEDNEVHEFVEPALQSARRGVQLIKRLLTFSRQQPLEPEAVDLGRLIASMSKLVRRSLPESIAVSTDLSAASVHVLADPGQLESALLNFALNARDAMPEGGQLHIAARPVELRNEAKHFDVPAGAYAMIEVSDNGSGMDAATLARVYEPFFTTKRFGLGSGLGLSMAYGFVKQSGGGLSIRSQLGEGTTVVMVLPLTTPEPDIDPQQDEAPLTHGGELVLLVEDEPNVRRVVRQQLIDLGYPVIEAENGVQALEMIAQIPDIAIVVSDVIMPGGVNGRQLAEQVLKDNPAMRLVLMSGYTDAADELAAGNLPVLAKPFVRKELAQALQKASKGKI